MKAFLTASFAFVYLALLSPAYPQSPTSPYAQLVADIDTYWVAKNHSAILQIINGRLSDDANDAFGLSLKRYYHTYAECDLQKARTSISELHSVVSALNNTSLTSLVSGLKNETDGIPLSESTPFSQAEIDAIHSIFPNRFPGVDLCEAIAIEVNSSTADP